MTTTDKSMFNDPRAVRHRRVLAEVDCPLCGSTAGHRCKAETGEKFIFPHDARTELWRLTEGRK